MLNPDFIPTGDMIADCLTKSVPVSLRVLKSKVRSYIEQRGMY